MIVELHSLTPAQVYLHMIQVLVPRPIAWVLSENASGSFNLAPFSYFNAVCSDPPLILISVGQRPEGGHKDTRVNIEQRRDFVVHIAHSELLDPLNASAASLPPEESEQQRLGLALAEFPGARLPRLGDCRIAMACSRFRIDEVGNAPQSLIFGQVEQLYISDEVAGRDAKGRLKVDAAALDPLGRLGAGEYASFGEVLRRARPD
jgi:flavin reductase (DIM6/NTAB) family NADH-FMN oxidoreductase RutF